MIPGLFTEGIFRLSGAAPDVEQLQYDFDRPPTYGKYLDLKDKDIHAITGVVKKYLRQLPDPPIPVSSHERFIQFFGKIPNVIVYNFSNTPLSIFFYRRVVLS